MPSSLHTFVPEMLVVGVGVGVTVFGVPGVTVTVAGGTVITGVGVGGVGVVVGVGVGVDTVLLLTNLRTGMSSSLLAVTSTVFPFSLVSVIPVGTASVTV